METGTDPQQGNAEMANEVVFNRIWTDEKAKGGNIHRVEWWDGSQTGYPTEEIRSRAIQAIADSKSRAA